MVGSGKIAGVGEPADVGPEEAVNTGRVGVDFFVGVLVVVAMDACPPEGTSLEGGAAPNGHDKLEGAGGAEGAMGKIAVVETGDSEHANHVEANGDDDGGRTPTNCQDQEAAEMDEEVGDAASGIDLPQTFVLLVDGPHFAPGVLPAEIGIERAAGRPDNAGAKSGGK